MKFKGLWKSICFLIIWTIIFWLFIWKIPIFLYLNSISLPPDCDTYKQKIEISDIGGDHILAEKVFISEQSLEELRDYTNKNNGKMREITSVHKFFYREWDDFAIYPDYYEEKIPENERNKYYVLVYDSLWFRVNVSFYLALIGLFSGIAIIIIYCVIFKFRRNLRKKFKDN